jgi:SEC-C motif-containing protein
MARACDCGSKEPADRCCGPLHAGTAEAASAEQLMRSRYAAFVRKDAGYLWRTLHPDHDDRGAGEAEYVSSLRKSFPLVHYKSLLIVDRRAPDAEGVALVLFAAFLTMKKGGDRSFVELSRFANDGTGWKYLFGAAKPLAGLDAKALRIGDGLAPE